MPDLSVDAWVDGLERVRTQRFDSTRLRTHAERFSRERCVEHMKAVIDDTLAAPAEQRW